MLCTSVGWVDLSRLCSPASHKTEVTLGTEPHGTDQRKRRTTQCSGLAIESCGVDRASSRAADCRRYPTQDSSRPTCHDNRPKPIESVSEPSRNFSAHTNVRVARHVGRCVHRNVRPSVPKNLAARWRIVGRTLDRLRCAVARRCVAVPRIFTTRPDKVRGA